MPTSGLNAAGSRRFAIVTGPVAPVGEAEPEAEDAGVGPDTPGVARADAPWDAPPTAAPDPVAGCAVAPGGRWQDESAGRQPERGGCHQGGDGGPGPDDGVAAARRGTAVHTGGFDGRADVYALAVVAYELLTGQKPFGPGGRAAALMTDQPTASTLPALPAGTELPPNVALLLRAAMSVDPADRPPTADRPSLRRRAAGSGPAVPAPGRPEVADPARGLSGVGHGVHGDDPAELAAALNPRGGRSAPAVVS